MNDVIIADAAGPIDEGDAAVQRVLYLRVPESLRAALAAEAKRRSCTLETRYSLNQLCIDLLSAGTPTDD